MALISNAKEGRADGGYTRLLGNRELGSLISKLHATVISSGTELEKILLEKISNLMTDDDFDNFIKNSLGKGVYVITKALFKKKLNHVLNTDYQPDFMIVVIEDRNIYIVELKDGDTFDTKKSEGEISVLNNVKDLLEKYLKRNKIVSPSGGYRVLVKFCSFNQVDKEKIVEGLKNKITTDMAMTGKELCELTNVNYNEIVKQRQEHQKQNFDFFLDSITKIKEVDDFLLRIYKP